MYTFLAYFLLVSLHNKQKLDKKLKKKKMKHRLLNEK